MSSNRNSQFSIGFFKETIAVQIILVVLFVGMVWFFDWSFFSSFGSSNGSSSASLATLVMDIKDSRRMFEGDVIEGMTITDVLNASAKAGGFDVQYRVSASTNDVIIDGINGYFSDQYQISFLLNGQNIVSKDLNRVEVRGSDTVEIRIR